MISKAKAASLIIGHQMTDGLCHACGHVKAAGDVVRDMSPGEGLPDGRVEGNVPSYLPIVETCCER